MIPGVSKEQFLGAVRAILTMIGGFLIAKGVEAGTIETVTGIVVTITGMIWSFASKVEDKPVAKIEPPVTNVEAPK